ncbi:reverse transcriptase domain-containing protein [Tanacetum coccineum]
MAAPVISILFDTSEESVGSHAPQVILFGVTLAIIPVIPEVPVVPANPIVTPEVGTVSVVSPAGADGESEPAEQRPVSSSHDTLAPLSEFPLAPCISSFIETSFSPDSSSSNAPSDYSLSRHTPPDTTDADSSTPQRFVPAALGTSPTMFPSSIALPLYVGISKGVIAHPEDGIGMGFKIAASDAREDGEEFEAEASAQPGRDLLCLVILEQWDYHSLQYLYPEKQFKVNRRVEEALAAHEATRAANALEAENQSQNGSDGDNGNDGNGDGENGNGENGNCGNGNPNKNGRSDRPVASECTCQDFIKCQPLNFKGTEGVVGLIRWFEKMETMFHISNCLEKSQVKYATCTLLNSALTWWNSHKRTIGTEAAFSMSWRELMKLMTKVYCPRNEIQKMETKLWNLTVKNNDLAAYT